MKNFICATILIFSLRSCFCVLGNPSNENFENNKCPKLYPKKFISYAPVGNLTAANYYEKKNLRGLKQCVLGCCVSDTCNVAFIINDNCYHLVCVSDELCLPLLRPLSKDNISMILVKPVLSNENWSDILDQSRFQEVKNNFATDDDSAYFTFGHQNDIPPDDEDSNMFAQFINNLPSTDDDDGDNARGFEKYRDNDGEMMLDASTFLEKEPCEVGVSECPYNSECVPISTKTRNGICKCIRGTAENMQGTCVPLRPFSKGPTNIDLLKNEDLDTKRDDLQDVLPTPATQNLTVSIISKEVQLPENEVTLDAYTIPDEKASNSHYNYVWTIVDQPKGGFTGNMNQNGATVTLTDLTEGQYRFKVTVNGTRAHGAGYATVTVRPAARRNAPPRAAASPPAQTVKLPNSMAVLDGSASKDDDAIISWHWELTSGPIGYQPPLQDKPTLVLNDLKQPGNYTFRLTVEDSDHVKNFTTANITVLSPTDYPPEANAGQDVIIYLPQNKLTLNGSLSTDDHEITSWEWTKAAGDENKAVDMQNTHSPYLQLSNLSEGIYTFSLRVADAAGQSSAADVHVFVKPPTNTPPAAHAGEDVFISLPQTWVILNGSASSDDHRIVAYTWRLAAGPGAVIARYNESVANATGLTKGQYVFTLTVLDDNGNSASDNVTVTVTQNKNSPPIANAGGDQILSLPVPVLTLNGSKSSDDFRVVSWRWARAAAGLAAGTVILGSDTKPVLMLTNIEAGRYVFELTVTDDQGESGRDAVSVQVKPDPLENSLLELTLNAPVGSFSQARLAALLQKLALLLGDDVAVNVTAVRAEIDSQNTQIIFFLWANSAALHGNDALARLAEGGAPAALGGGARLRSVRCLSSCSGRGTCDQAARACRCDAFWMQSLLPAAQPDCAWSVVYLCVGGVAALGALCGAGAGCARLCARRGGAGRGAGRAASYRLLPRADRTLRPLSKDLSDSETDSDVLFESQKTTSFTRAADGELPARSSVKKNGHYKPRKIKT